MVGVYCCPAFLLLLERTFLPLFVELPLLLYVYVTLVLMPVTVLKLPDHKVKWSNQILANHITHYLDHPFWPFGGEYILHQCNKNLIAR